MATIGVKEKISHSIVVAVAAAAAAVVAVEVPHPSTAMISQRIYMTTLHMYISIIFTQ